MTVATKALIAALSVLPSVSRPALAQRAGLTTDSVIAWLPANTETLIVAKGPFDVADTSDDGAVRLALALSQSAAAGGLLTRKPNILQSLHAAHIRFIVEGARNFRRPTDLGLGPYEGCHVIVFDNADGPLIDRFLREVRAAADGAAHVEGMKALRLQWRSEQDDWSAFVVRARTNVIVIATSETMLSEVLGRAERGGSGRALPASLLEWTRIDTTARVWAVRHYARAGSDGDPTSPISGQRRAANMPDALAVGITVSVNADSGGFVAHYLSDNPQAASVAREYWTHPNEGLTPTVDAEPNGNVRIAVASASEEARAILLLAILAALGHAVYL